MRLTDISKYKGVFREEDGVWLDRYVNHAKAVGFNKRRSVWFPHMHIRFSHGKSRLCPVIGFDFDFDAKHMSSECYEILEKMSACSDMRCITFGGGMRTYDIAYDIVFSKKNPVDKSCDELHNKECLSQAIYNLAENFDSFNKLEYPNLLDITLYMEEPIDNVLTVKHYSEMFKNCTTINSAPIVLN